MLAQPHEDIYIRSKDGLKLHATYFPNGETDKIVICFHGYTSEGMSDYIGLKKIYSLKVRETEFEKTPSKKIKRY